MQGKVISEEETGASGLNKTELFILKNSQEASVIGVKNVGVFQCSNEKKVGGCDWYQMRLIDQVY